MPELVDVLSSYVPLVVQHRFERDARPLKGPEVQRCRGSLLFLDISGFTALAEVLARDGRAGTEQLSATLNSYFDRLIDLITDYGGDVVKLAGDSVIALWEADREEDGAVAAARAAQCGLAAHHAVADVAATAVHQLELRGSVGSGDMALIFLGGPSDRWELLLVGEPLARIASGSRLARTGQLVADRETWALLDGRFAATPLDNGFVQVTAVLRGVDRYRTPAPVLPDAARQALLTYLPEGVKARLLAGHSGWLAELRRASVVFINLQDWNESAATALKRTQLVMSAMQRIVYQFEGSINKLTVDDKGVTLLAVLGLPPFAHEDDPVRAVRCALALQAKLRELSARSAIGVTTGHVYCGLVGNERRREYTVIGGVVNLAARLMHAAPGDVLCDEATQSAAAGHIRFEPLPSLTLKGFAQPIAVHRPFSRHVADHDDRPLIGRAAETTFLIERLDALSSGRSAAVLVEGDAGIGKSRLIAELRREAERRGMRCYSAAGSSIERSSAYHAWRSVFAQLLGLDDGDGDVEAIRRAIADRLGDAEMRPLAPLLNAVLPVALPENELTEGLSGSARAANTNDVLTAVLQSEAGRGPLVIVIEDAHWMDSASLSLAARAARLVSPALMVVTSRPLTDALSGEQQDLLSACVDRRRLHALDGDDTARLVASRLGVRRIPDRVAALIARKAQGNPFFSEELAIALRDAGVLRVDRGECEVPAEVDLDAITVPDSIEGVVTGRMDRLSPGEQLALKVASVIGRVFAFRILRDVHPIEPERPHLNEYLQAVSKSELADVDPTEPDLSYVFRHAITHEVAYNLMLFGQRRQLHKAVAEWYAATFAADLRPHYPVLAYHYKRAEEPEPALRYADLAARDMSRQGAYREAIQFLTDALAFNRPSASVDPRETRRREARWEAALGDAYIGIGDVAASRAHTLRALAALEAPAPRSKASTAGALVSEAVAQLMRGARASSPAARTEDARERARQAALATERLGHLCYFDGDFLTGLYAAVRCTNLADRSGDAAARARAYADFAMALMVLGFKNGAERYCVKAESLLGQVDDQSARAWTHQLLGIYASSMGQWERTRRHLDEAIHIARATRDFRRQEESSIHRILVSYQSARFEDGLSLARSVGELTTRQGHKQEHLWSMQHVALNLTRLGRVHEAADVTANVPDDAIQAMGRTEQIWHYGAQALCCSRAGREAAAAAAAEHGVAALLRVHPMMSFDLEGTAGLAEALCTLSERSQDAAERARFSAMSDQALRYLNASARLFPVGAARAAIWRGARMHARGRAAAPAFVQALAIAEQKQLPYEQGLAHFYLSRVSSDRGAAEHHAREATAAFTRLGAAFDAGRANLSASAPR